MVGKTHHYFQTSSHKESAVTKT